MSEETVAFTKEGVKLSYGRFLSDSAGGYVMLLLVAHLFPGIIPSALTNSSAEPNTAAIVLMGVFVLLLGPALGLALNSLSWFSLGFIQVVFLNKWGQWSLLNRVVNVLTYHTGQEYNVALLQRTFTFLNPANRADARGPGRSLYSQLHLIQRVMQAHAPHLLRRAEYLTGIKIFTRNLSALCLVMVLWKVHHEYKTPWREDLGHIDTRWWLIGFVALTLLACFLELYGALELSFSAYSVCLKRNPALAELPSITRSDLPWWKFGEFWKPREFWKSKEFWKSLQFWKVEKVEASTTFAQCIDALLAYAHKSAEQPDLATTPDNEVVAQ